MYHDIDSVDDGFYERFYKELDFVDFSISLVYNIHVHIYIVSFNESFYKYNH